MPQLLTAGQADNWQYGWSVSNLQQCLNDHITNLVSDEEFKCPSGAEPPSIRMAAPFVYSNVIPAAIMSAEGAQDPPIVPSILIECHSGDCVLPHRPNYMINVRLLIAVWDDDPTMVGYLDIQHLTEKIFLYLLKERSLSDRYLLVGKVSWKILDSRRAEYFISVIEMTYDLDPVPDASDNVDQWLLNDDHVTHIDFDKPEGFGVTVTKTGSGMYSRESPMDALDTNLPLLVEENTDDTIVPLGGVSID